ncbi:MAG: hypothetical protein ACPGRD_01335 [Planktomarina sp.]
MSESDSFIAEVTEDVRRDKLFATFRKYGWIAGVIIVALVGGTAYSEWSKAQADSAAQARGDAILVALDSEAAQARQDALATLASAQDASVIEKLLASDVSSQQAAEFLSSIAQDGDQPKYISDLAALKLTMVPNAMTAAEVEETLQGLAVPGQLYRNSAVELLVAAHLEAGKTEEALLILQDQIKDAEAPRAQVQRFVELIVALGATPELANQSATDSQN